MTRDRNSTRLREADAIVVHEIKRGRTCTARRRRSFAVLLPIQSVGVMGDARTYEDVVAVRADQHRRLHDGRLVAICLTNCLARISTRIINEVPGVNRVVYDISSKPPATIEWE